MRPPEAWPVARTMQALELLSFQPLSAPQVASALQIHPRTARRLLNRLREEGYLTRSDDARRLYTPTMRLVALAGQLAHRARLTQHAVPVVAALQRETGGSAHLAIPSYRSVVCVVHADGGPVTPEIGELVPSHCTATGKALLSYRQDWRDSVLRTRLAARTARTLTDPAALRQETDAVRQRGYAIEDEEYAPSTRGVAAPVFTSTGEAIAALGVSLEGDSSFEALAARVVPAARSLTEALANHHG